MKIGIVIPTYHEEDNIVELCNRIHASTNKLDIFLCFVDDSKNNKTEIQIKTYCKNRFHIIRGVPNKSIKISKRCFASRQGFMWLNNNFKPDIYVEIDSDLAQKPEEIMHGCDLMNSKKYDLVIASKYKKFSQIKNRSQTRNFISFFYTKICRLFFSTKITDYSNSYRFYNKNLMNFILENKKLRFESPIEHLDLLLFILKNNFLIGEFASIYEEREKGESTIKYNDYPIYILEFIKCIFKNLI